MSTNYIVSRDGVTVISGDISGYSWLVANVDLETLIKDGDARCALLDRLGQDVVVLANLGKLEGNTYNRNSKSVLKVGDTKWN